MLRPFYKFFFDAYGWKITGSISPAIPKYVMIVAPHTSNCDFLVGLAARSVLRLETKYLGKKELFRFPFGIFFRYWGGYPVDRSHHTNIVEEVAKLYEKYDRFSIAIAPEGTRKHVKELKTGFYHIARRVKIPIIMVGFDYSKKEVSIAPPFFTGDNIESDLEMIKTHYRNIKGKYPGNGIT